MNKKASVFSRIALAVTLLFTILGIILRIVLMQNYDFENGFYTNDFLHAVLKYTLVGFAVLSFAATYIYI